LKINIAQGLRLKYLKKTVEFQSAVEGISDLHAQCVMKIFKTLNIEYSFKISVV
jgi:hypothetical protein